MKDKSSFGCGAETNGVAAGAHTPGPWKWWTSCSFRRLSSEATGRDGDVLHAVIQRGDGHPDVHFPNGGANGPDARLIAAAPDLLAALNALVFVAERELADPEDCGALHAAKDAIAKCAP